MKHQDTIMKFDPATGAEKPYPSHAEQWRQYHLNDAFLFNPWSGTRRLAGDVGTDPRGYAIWPSDEASKSTTTEKDPTYFVVTPGGSFVPAEPQPKLLLQGPEPEAKGQGEA